MIKTTATRFAAVERLIRSRSSYELPEVLAVPVETGSAAYLSWLQAAVEPRDRSDDACGKYRRVGFAAAVARHAARRASALSLRTCLPPEQVVQLHGRRRRRATFICISRFSTATTCTANASAFDATRRRDALRPAEFPSGEIHEDEFFGKQETYRGRFDIAIPYTARPPRFAQLTLKLQGCADFGLCYPPQDWNTDDRAARGRRRAGAR